MKKGIRQKIKCRYCENLVIELYTKDRFKGYGKTCNEHRNNGRKRGKFNNKWKGGKTKRQGYVYILDERKNEKAGISRYTAEHTLVAEEKYGRKVDKNELVHHLNGVRDDNRPENLIIINRKGHETWTYVRSLQKRIRELEVLLNARSNN